LEGGGLELDQFETRRSAMLLARLALSHRKSFTRLAAAELLWPDDFYEATRQRLRQELARLRRGLGPVREILQTDEETISLATQDLAIDVQNFDRLCEMLATELDPGAKERLCLDALSLASEPLLEGLYEPWIDAERRRIAERRYGLLVALGELQSIRGDHEAALETANRALELDQMSEDAHLIAMRELRILGYPSEAMGQFQQLKRILRDELSDEPSNRAKEAALEVYRSKAVPYEPRPVTAGLAFAVPASAEPIYGRANEIFQLQSLLHPNHSAHRIVTLIGPGGIGKTRLAQEVALSIVDSFGGRVAWIGLSDIDDAAIIPQIIARTLRITLNSSSDPLERLVALLPREPTLLILDNLEQLLPGGTAVIRALSEARSSLKLLLTSRVALNLGGERSVSVGPLERGERDDPAVQFLLDPLVAERGGQVLGAEDLRVLGQIADRLDRIPLALQLVSGRLRTLTAQELFDQLGNRLDLVNRRPDAPERHRTIRASVESCFQALPEALKQAMGRLCVFRGGWNRGGAAYLCELDDPLSTLEELIDRSLVRVERTGSGYRFRMLETIRDYVKETLTPEELTAAQQRHLDWVLHLMPNRYWRHQTIDALNHFKTIDPELDNLREATRYAIQNDLEGAVKLGATFGNYWTSRSLSRDAAAFYEQLFRLESDLPVTEDLARASFWEGHTLFLLNRYGLQDRGYDVAQRSSRLCEQAGLKVEQAMCLIQQGRRYFLTGEFDENLRLVDDAEAMIGDGSTHDLAVICQQRATAQYYLGHVHEAIQSMERSISLLGDECIPFHQVQCAMMLSFMHLEIEQPGKAAEYSGEALRLAESFGLAHFIPMIHEACGKASQALGDLHAAAGWFLASAESWEVFGNDYQHGDQLHHLARVHIQLGEPEKALPLLSRAAKMWLGKNLTSVVPCALTTLARAHLQMGSAALGARYLGTVANLSTPTRDGNMPSEIAFVAELRQGLEEALGPEEVQRLLQDAPSLEQALREAFA